MTKKSYSYLALGDSYTIGEGVGKSETFPHQLVQKLRDRGYKFQEPKIIATTGWTTKELQTAIKKANLDKHYDFVSLLVGVNNQYRGLNIDDYEEQFESLLKQSIFFSGNIPSHVFVLSIPDWGVTPFAEGRDRYKIGFEIDRFNTINRKVAIRYKVNYIDITQSSRDAAADHSLLTDDNLHPSGKEYARWASKLFEKISKKMSD